jgi:hypothetical protein
LIHFPRTPRAYGHRRAAKTSGIATPLRQTVRESRRPPKRFLLRLPVSLHKQASLAAAKEGVSLNQFICGLVAAAVQWQSQATERTGPYPRTNDEFVADMWADLLR